MGAAAAVAAEVAGEGEAKKKLLVRTSGLADVKMYTNPAVLKARVAKIAPLVGRGMVSSCTPIYSPVSGPGSYTVEVGGRLSKRSGRARQAGQFNGSFRACGVSVFQALRSANPSLQY